MKTLAVDFGGRRIKLGLVKDGKVAAQEVLPARAEEPLARRLTAVAETLKQLCARAKISPAECSGVSIAYPSIIDPARARSMDHFGKYGDASAFDFRAWAKENFDLPLAIDNDARMALLGEWQYGSGRDCDNLVMITLGTGLGVAAVIEGKILRGAHGQAGILGGHFTVQCGGRACVCGNLGCAEAEASTSVLGQLAREHRDFPRSALAAEPVVDYAALFRLAAQGDACARSLAKHSLRVWSALAVSVVHAFDPERLILGGGVMGSAETILPTLRNYVDCHAHTPWGKVRVEVATLGDQAALLAGEWLLREQFAGTI